MLTAEKLAANTAAYWDQYRAAVDAVALAHADRITAPIDPAAPDRELCRIAEGRAELMRRTIDKRTDHAPVTLEWLNDQTAALQARPFEPKKRAGEMAEQLAGFVKRASCPAWWRRQVRRVAVRTREGRAQAAGLVSAWPVRTAQPYVTNETAERRQEQHRRNRAMLEATEIENAAGQKCTLWDAFMASVACKAIRRGELMTRIRGCEEWAIRAGMVGMFTTHTAPSRFHTSHHGGGRNAKHDGSTPKDAQAWLCRTWARARAQFKREGLKVFGFRVAEPHHDGCPHWHMLIWTEPGQADRVREVLRAQWLREEGTEKGAAEHRFKCEAIDPAKGGAIAYVAKYIAKNIDDQGAAGADGHTDDEGGAAVVHNASAQRVDAWAAAWGIRQFQAMGQPPVTVWRELRRVLAEQVEGASDRIRQGFAAVNREGARRACWREYLDAQGGAMTGRDYRLRLAVEMVEREGAYGRTLAPQIHGVWDVAYPGVSVPSNRQPWRAAGEWTPEARDEAARGIFGWARDNVLRVFARAAQPTAQPRTRVNNCTRAGGPGLLMQSELLRAHAAQHIEFEAPGGTLETDTPWIPPKPPTCPSLNSPPLWLARLKAHRSSLLA